MAVTGNAADFFEYFKKNIVPSLVTDQTSAHDPLYGYVPRDMDLNAAQLLRSQDPKNILPFIYNDARSCGEYD